MKKRTIHATDLFCGAGGTSAGLLHACKRMGYELKLSRRILRTTRTRNTFVSSYHFTGTKELQMKQIGNAVPVRTASALCEALLA